MKYQILFSPRLSCLSSGIPLPIPPVLRNSSATSQTAELPKMHRESYIIYMFYACQPPEGLIYNATNGWELQRHLIYDSWLPNNCAQKPIKSVHDACEILSYLLLANVQMMKQSYGIFLFPSCFPGKCLLFIASGFLSNPWHTLQILGFQITFIGKTD